MSRALVLPLGAGCQLQASPRACLRPQVPQGVVSAFLYGSDTLCPGRGATLEPRAEGPLRWRAVRPAQVSNPPRVWVCVWCNVGLWRPPPLCRPARGPAPLPELPPLPH